MSIFNDFPYSNFHGENLDWILSVVKRCNETLNNLNNMIASEVATELKPQMEEFREYYTTLLKDFEEELRKRATEFEAAVNNELSGYQSQVDDVKASFDNLKQETEAAIAKYQSDFTELENKFNELKSNTDNFITLTTATVQAIQTETSDFIKQSTQDINEMQESIKDFVAKTEQDIEGIKTDIENGFDDITGLINSTSVAVCNKIKEGNDEIETAVATAGFSVMNRIKESHETTDALITTSSTVAMGKRFDEIIGKLDSGDTNVINEINSLSTEIAGYHTETGGKLDAMQEKIDECGGLISTITTSILNELGTDLTEIENAISTASTAIAKAIEDKVSDIVLGDITVSNQEVERLVTEKAQEITDKLDNLDTSVLEELITTTSTAIGDKIDECCESMNTITGTILSQVQQNETSITALSGNVSTLSSGVDELKKSVSDSKTALAAAITEKGIETAADAAFNLMVKNIKDIELYPVQMSIWLRCGAPKTDYPSGAYAVMPFPFEVLSYEALGLGDSARIIGYTHKVENEINNPIQFNIKYPAGDCLGFRCYAWTGAGVLFTIKAYLNELTVTY